ncbi:MAG: hypothetical protein LBB89_11665 [Treponema sp.]|jgi:hypothetical protein|nr:hypothetical protein [Treponema sp.]
MFSFLRKKSLVTRAALVGAVLVLLTSFLFVSCADPIGTNSINAQKPNITGFSAAGTWNVSSADTFSVTVTATSPDGGTLNYQWYLNSTNSNSGGSILAGKTAKTLSLAKADYPENKDYYFYVAVTNTNNSVIGNKTAAATSNAATVTVTGNIVPTGIQITSQADMEKIGVAGTHPLNGDYVLMNNITLSNWSPIGDATTPFTGKFNGYGMTVTLNGFNATAVSGKTYLGIFGYVKGASSSAKAEIKNLTIASSVNASSTATSAQYVGLLTGYAEQTVIENNTLSGTLTFQSSGNVNVSGGIGSPQAGTLIKDCNSSMSMNISPGGSGDFGGIAGRFSGGVGIENCHNTGNVTVVSTASASQIFVGGITTGSSYGFSTAYNGYIQDCSYIGTVTAKATGNWTWAGGIASVICGGTTASLESTTRIERCFVEGTVSVEGATSAYPYVGGIVAYVYYGALVSQSYFKGSVLSNNASDYAGGIAGYNSQTTAPNNSRIEDCWSSGTVKANSTAVAGIAGQNQVNAYVRRCYSTAASARNNGTAGGSIATTNMTNVIDCVGLNTSLPSLQSAGTAVPDEYLSGGKPIQAYYQTVLNWDFTNVWKMGSDGYPKLKWQQ